MEAQYEPPKIDELDVGISNHTLDALAEIARGRGMTMDALVTQILNEFVVRTFVEGSVGLH